MSNSTHREPRQGKHLTRYPTAVKLAPTWPRRRRLNGSVGSRRSQRAGLVEGYAFGAGLSLAISSDFVVAADNAKFCATFARVGLVPDTGLFYTLAQRVGMSRAKRMITLAESSSPQSPSVSEFSTA